MYTIGINAAYHESAACLACDGHVVSAIEEERLTRHKHGKDARVDNAGALPLRAIEHCLRTVGIRASDVERIGYSLVPSKRLRNVALTSRSLDGSWGSEAGERRFYEEIMRVPARLAEVGFRASVAWLDHHLCHAASSFFPSPFDESAVLCVDGIAETASTMFAVGRGDRIHVLETIDYPASIGFLWERVSTFLGFGEHDACKVMGLSAYAQPDGCIAERMRALIELLPGGRYTMREDVLRFRSPDDAILGDWLGVAARTNGAPIRREHEQVAAALQRVTDELLLHLVSSLHERIGGDRLCLAGGVALNCVSNRAIMDRSPFRRLFVPSAPHDAGTAIGAALLVSAAAGLGTRHYRMDHTYLGPRFDNAAAASALTGAGLPFERPQDLEGTVAELIAGGNVVGWFQGAMEFGPRALGNRSLLADPRNPGMRDVLNHKVKHREHFRPFAPSVLAEHAAEWFDLGAGGQPLEFMLASVSVHPARHDQIPAVVHIDGTSRVQVVRANVNQRYHALLQAFYRRTGVPILLNTSFNDDEPIVCTPLDAIRTFQKTSIDYLAIEDLLARH